MRRIVDICKQTGLPFKTIPSYGELINGRVTVNSIREVAYSDLLRREVVKLDEERIGAHILGKVILVTGAAGSIGSELCRQICRFRPGLLILFERSESPLYDLELELNASYPHIRLQAVLGDILDVPHLEATFDRHQPHMVFHAAAYKHVPMLENQPWRAVINNIVGTRNVVDNACRTGVNRFVFVSTDKAVRPANIMGATKCVAEKLVQCCCLTNGNETKFMTVRFGNVVGSIGSVVPLFKKQIAQGGPVTVTHPEVTRFFMTIPEASQLILQAGAMGEGGEIYVLKMGTAIKIDDMARDLIHLSGFEPDVDIKIEYIGLRPGEKLYEELISEGEGINPTGHDKILVLQGVACDAERLDHQIEEMQKLAAAQDGDGIRALLSAVVPEFKPSGVPEDPIETDSDSPADTIAFPISSSSS
jgi:FlaA1/EpsC-like NDP-sugar epimerase